MGADAAVPEGERLMGRARREGIPAKVKVAIEYLINQKADYQAAALHAQITTLELRRSMGQPHIRRYALEQRQLALEAFCLGSPAALTEIRDTSENSMARVQAVKTGELLRVGAIEEEGRAQRRAPGLQIVIVSNDGKPVAHQPPPPPQMLPALDITPASEAEPVPADADAEPSPFRTSKPAEIPYLLHCSGAKML
jgi:hypothetical protein